MRHSGKLWRNLSKVQVCSLFMDISNIWQRIESWLQQYAPEILKTLNDGASDEIIRRLETQLGLSLPDDFKPSLAVHNGQRPDFYPRALLEQWELISNERILEQWLFLKDFYDAGEFADNKVQSDEGLTKEWWHPAWLPITDNHHGDRHCIDLTPGPTYGNILIFWHDYKRRKIESVSFAAWLEKFADDLEASVYEVSARGNLQEKS
jgi:cell wall assembly regulator SMI1